ncbi:WD repeat-containing protein 53 [Kappamyces sp. JEL0829]|nr:WD repeat-containing protein 53 [Kappamyces sp. JEL0829]
MNVKKVLASNATISCIKTSLENDSQFYAAASDQLGLWDATTGQTVLSRPIDGISSMTLSTTQHSVVYFARLHQVYVLDTRSAERPKMVWDGQEEINEIAFHPLQPGNLLVADDSTSLSLIDISTGKSTTRFRRDHDNIVSCCSFRPKLPWHAVSGGFDCTVHLWDISRGLRKYSHTFTSDAMCNPPHIHSLQFSPNGSTLALGLGSGDISLLDLPRHSKSTPENSLAEARLEGHSWSVSGLAWLSAVRMVSVSIDKSIRLWDIPTRTCIDSYSDASQTCKWNALDVVGSSLVVGGVGQMLLLDLCGDE